MSVMLLQILFLVASASALTVPHGALRSSTLRMQAPSAADVATETVGVVAPTSTGSAEMWQLKVKAAQERAKVVKAEQDATIGAMATGAIGLFLLPGTLLLPFDAFFADLFLSTIIGAAVMGYLAGFREDSIGDGARKLGSTVASTTGQLLEASKPLVEEIKSKIPGSDGEGITYADIKKFGVSGTIAYILTELAFWAVAFPVASTSFFNLNGHWPDFSDGGDRTAVLAFIFAGANVARLVVPLRFGAAVALIPWVDENICKRFGIGGDADESKQ